MKLYYNINKLYTFKGFAKKQGLYPDKKDFTPLKDAAFVVEKGLVKWAGKESKLPKEFSKIKSYDLQSSNVFPAFTESHTHLVFAGNRKAEFEMKIQGATYQEIQQAGGGISNTVRSTKKASVEELKKLAQKRLQSFKKQGVSLLEVKSGYGQDLKTELKQLEVAFSLKGLKVSPTYLALHSFKGDKDHYIKRVFDKDLPQVLKRFPNLKRVDLFVEKNFFDLKDLKKFVAEIQKYNLNFCAHVDQLSSSGAALESLKLGAFSVEHAVHIKDSEIKKASQYKGVFNLLPAADFYLKVDYPPARKLIDGGLRVSLATDYNPGTSPTKDLGFIGVLARREMKMTLAEVWAAYTVNASRALGFYNRGALIRGYQADFFTSEAEPEDFFYEVGEHPVQKTYF